MQVEKSKSTTFRGLGRWAFAEFTDVYQIGSDFEARVEAEFNKMIDSVIAQRVDSGVVAIERAGAYLSKQFGSDTKWAELNLAIWTIIKSTPDHALRLSDIDSLAESVSCDGDEILSVLALFSRPSVRLLRMELRSEKHNGVEVKMTDFISKLKEWWKRKEISEEEWRRWSSNIRVRWIPVSKWE